MKIRTGFLLCIAVSILAGALRTYQLLVVVDPATGFYAPGSLSVPLLNGLLIASTLFFLIFRLRLTPCERKKDPRRVLFTPGTARAIICFLTAAAFLFYAYGQVTGSSVALTSFLTWILPAFAILSSFFFALLGSYCLFRRISPNMAAVALFPLVWAAARLVTAFLEYTSIANISGHLFDVLYMVAILLFLFSQGKAIAQPDNPSGIAAFGFCSVLFLTVTAIPNTLAAILGKTIFTDLQYVSGLVVNLLLLVYLLSTLLELSRRKASD